jgi:hypothetical protein
MMQLKNDQDDVYEDEGEFKTVRWKGKYKPLT